ncbi:MAG: AAA-associated domain-containing protein [Alphaproteobacteria bacterium]|nr:AAA-associated domain-containing protein [Alphaproteobacteria bacterium]
MAFSFYQSLRTVPRDLEDHMPRREAERTLRAVISWDRYAELFAYDRPQAWFCRLRCTALSHVPVSASIT